MNPTPPPSPGPARAAAPDPVSARVAAKLHAIRRRGTRVRLLAGACLAVAVLLGGVTGAMLLDRVVGWFDPRARTTVTVAVMAMAAAALGWGCLRPLLRRRSLDTAAREADLANPGTEERFTTVTGLAQSHDAAPLRGSDALIRKVGAEAEAAEAAIRPDEVVPAGTAWRAARVLAGAAAVLAVVFLVQGSQAPLLWQRFWFPGRDLSLTRITASPGDVWVPRGEPLTLTARVEGRIPAEAPRIQFRGGNAAGERAARAAVMTPQAGGAGSYRFALDAVAESFEYRVRAGDGQTPWRTITVADRPRITEVRLRVVPPAYSRLPAEEGAALPPALRLLEGTALEIGFRADQPLERMALDLGDGRSVVLKEGADRWYRFEDQPTNHYTLVAAAWNRFRLDNPVKPTCQVSVYEDRPPTLRILEPSDEVSVAPGDKVTVAFEARDDFGLARAEIQVTRTTPEGATNQVTLPVDLGSDAGAKEFRKVVELDPATLGARHGDQLSYVVQVTDTREAPSRASGPDASARTAAELAARTSAEPASEPESPAAERPGDPAAAAEAAKAAAEAAKAAAGTPHDAERAAASALAASRPSEAKPANGDGPPPNAMSRRGLDAGQCTACQPRNIKVDEWAGTFDGEKRRKLEIAIEPVLRELDGRLARAEEGAGALRRRTGEPGGLVAADGPRLAGARQELKEARTLVAGLQSRTAGTPYAFIGLQLRNITEKHVQPADGALARVVTGGAGEAAAGNAPALDEAAFHLARARALLADLTRSFETVKRDQQVADAMQRLSRMYQVFLEDTQALLGGGKGPINQYGRKIAEVDEAYVEKLKALLEEKKKIMAELAKVLAEDPRLLRRYLAMLQLESTSYRDQMTLLARRQQDLESVVRQWNEAPEAERGARLDDLRRRDAAALGSVIESGNRLRDSLETWLPLDLPADHAEIRPLLARAERFLLLAARSGVPAAATEGAATNAPVAAASGAASGREALDELRALRDALPAVAALPVTNRARLDAYVANRLGEVESLISAQSGRLAVQEALDRGEFARAVEVIQQRITAETAGLEEKLAATEAQVSSMSAEIAAKASELNRIVREEVIEPQKAAGERLAAPDVPGAGGQLAKVVPAFERAETVFDELMRLIVARLDDAPPPGSPGGTQDLESLLSMLQDEMKAAEGLGISCRPINVSIQKDWMRPGSGQQPGSGSGRSAQAQAQAARGQAQQGQAEARRLEREARNSARQALAQAQAGAGAGDGDDADSRSAAGRDGARRPDAWNRLASTLDRNLLQGRDHQPPEQYREAIAQYFKTLAGAGPGADAGAGTGTGTGTGAPAGGTGPSSR